MSSLRAAQAAAFAAFTVGFAASIAGCQLKASPVPQNFITVDPNTFVLKSVQRYEDPNGTQTDSSIIVVTATYTNREGNPQTIGPDKFALLDPNLMATYVGQSGGGIDIPAMPMSTLAPGKSVDIQVGFRVPAAMSGARLVYHP